jgi:hypothetical protein
MYVLIIVGSAHHCRQAVLIIVNSDKNCNLKNLLPHSKLSGICLLRVYILIDISSIKKHHFKLLLASKPETGEHFTENNMDICDSWTREHEWPSEQETR